jgi:hypothetical protein
MFTFITLPIGLAQLAILEIRGFSLGHELLGLLWSQVLFFGGLLLVMALASVTSGLVPFSFAALILAALAAIPSIIGMGAPPRNMTQWPVGIEWVRNSTFGIALVAIAVCVVFLQYRYRETLLSRIGGVAGLALAAVLYLGMPSAWGFSIQSRLSREPSLESAVQLSLDRNQIQTSTALSLFLTLPISVAGLPQGVDVRSDAATVTFEWPGKPAWKTDRNGMNRRSKDGSIDVHVAVPASVFHANLDAPLTLRGSLYLTLFGNAETRTIPLETAPVTAQDGLTCFYLQLLNWDDSARHFACQSFFRWPSRLVYASTGEVEMDFHNLISYSPFPATLTLNPREEYWAGSVSASARRINIITKEPLAYFRRDFEVRGIRLADMER